MSIKQHDNTYIQAGKHIDDKYFNENNQRYASVEAVYARIPKAERVLDGVHNVNGVEYWFHTNTDVLEIKTGQPLDDFITSSVPINEAVDGNIVTWHSTTGRAAKMSPIIANSIGQMVLDTTGLGLAVTSDYVAIEAEANGADSFAMSAKSNNVPIQLCNMSTAPTGERIGSVMRCDSAHITVANGFALTRNVRMPILGWTDPLMSELNGFREIIEMTDVAVGSEDTSCKWEILINGIPTIIGWLDGEGLHINGNLYADNSSPVGIRIYEQEFTFPDIEVGKIYTLTLDASASAIIKGLVLRCDEGEVDVTLSINTADVIGCANVTADTGKQTFTAIGANTVAVGNEITLTIVTITDATSLTGVLKLQR